MVPYLTTLSAVNINNWIVKASVFDEQILIIFHNEYIMCTIVRVFDDEDEAHNFLESVVKNGSSIENCYRGRSSSSN
jgi:hypothetical protein